MPPECPPASLRPPTQKLVEFYLVLWPDHVAVAKDPVGGWWQEAAQPHRVRWCPKRALVRAFMLTLTLGSCASQPGVPREMRAWNRSFPAHRVIGNIYYVGSNEIAQFLITTSAGHILIDSGFEASVPRLRANVEQLGFRFEDVKFLISSHAHIDHAQGHALVRGLTGATVVTSSADAVFISAGGRGETVFDGVHAWTPCPVDRVVGDLDRVTLGGTTLTAHLTPGHTKGAITWTMQVVEQGKTLDVVFFPSANVNTGVRLVGNPRYPEIAADFERSFATWKALPVRRVPGRARVFLRDEREVSTREGRPVHEPLHRP